jgi:hypothetical protein
MTIPSPQDIQNAATRRAIADHQAAEYAGCMKLALGFLGPGWTPWMKIVLIDSDYHKPGVSREPVATAYKVYRGEEKLTENSVYLRKTPDGTVRKADNCEELFGDLLTEPHPTRKLELFHGQVVPAPRWTICWSALELYEPRNAQQLAEAREHREERKMDKEAAENPLFADQILAREWRPEKKPRGRE